MPPTNHDTTAAMHDATETLRDAHRRAVQAWSELAARQRLEDVPAVELLDAGNALNHASAALVAHLSSSAAAASNAVPYDLALPSLFENSNALSRLAALNPWPVRLTDLGDALPHIFKFLSEHVVCNVLPSVSKEIRREAPGWFRQNEGTFDWLSYWPPHGVYGV